MGRVVVVGSINVDLVLRVAHLPLPGETVSGGEFRRHGGGKGANAAAAAARYGAAVTLIGSVGDDELGRDALADLAARGVDVSLCLRLATSPTGVALMVVDAAGENQIAVAPGANATLDPAAVINALTEAHLDADDVLLTGFEVSDAVVVAALESASARGATTIVNPGPARPLLPVVSARSPILTPNRDEAHALTGTADPAAAASALAAQTRAPVIVTLGADGALLFDPTTGRPATYPALPVDPVDTTGAGDTLNGILAAELAVATDLSIALRRAVVGASLSTQAAGARQGMPTAADVAVRA